MTRFILFLSFVAIPLLAMWPAPSIVMDVESAVFNGSGCATGGSVELIDASNLLYEIKFDGFVLETGKKGHATYESRACHISLPIVVGTAHKVAVTKISYSGFNHLHFGAESRVLSEAFFSGRRAPLLQKVYIESGEFHTDTLLTESEKSWSPCSHDSVLNLNIMGEIRGEGSLNSSTVIDGQVLLKLEVKSC